MKIRLSCFFICLLAAAIGCAPAHAIEEQASSGGGAPTAVLDGFPAICFFFGPPNPDPIDNCILGYQRRLYICQKNYDKGLKNCPGAAWAHHGIETDAYLECKATFAAAKVLCDQDAKDFRDACLANIL